MAEPSLIAVDSAQAARQAPWSEEAEISVLSAMLIDGDAVAQAVELIDDMGGHPLIYAETEQKPDRRTLLFYGHYDVQPPDPLDEWVSPPFEPQVRDGKIFARGATDEEHGEDRATQEAG